jgi:hypothetical protein
VIFENDKIRILEITGAPCVAEPMYAHKWVSVMWSANPIFAKARLVYYHYGFDSLKKTYYVKDSFFEHRPSPNRDFEIPAEGPPA